jgi:hypothetical protein
MVTATKLPPRTSERTNAAREDRGGRCAPSAGRGIGRLRKQQDGTMARWCDPSVANVAEVVPEES